MDSTDKAFTGALSHDPTAIWLALCEIQPNETARITASVRLFAEEKEGTLRKLMTKKGIYAIHRIPITAQTKFHQERREPERKDPQSIKYHKDYYTFFFVIMVRTHAYGKRAT